MTERAQLVPLVADFAKARVLCIGDVMLDHFHYGTVERISPEAPIPVLRVEREDAMLGGAGNVVRNLGALGVQVRFVTIVGDDNAGKKVGRQIKDQKIKDAPLVDDGRRTSTKLRYIAGVQQVLRADHETDHPLSPKIEKKLIGKVSAAIRGCKAVVLSDYGKGVLSGTIPAKIIKMARKAKKTVIVDPKGADFGRYRGADVITPNRRELALATGLETDTAADVVKAAKRLIRQYRFGAVLVTLSADGMTLVTAKGGPISLPAEALEVFDVSGAGDSVAATVAAALATGMDIADAAALANVAAGIVVGKVGTAAVYADDLIAALHHQDITSAEAKVLSQGQAKDLIGLWRRAGHKIGFTNGCFDLLHPGHISLLKQARKACGRLVVGLNSDASVKRLKGNGRPVQSEAARAQVLASLASVDAVVIFAEKTPIDMIKAFKPDVLVKGADYDVDGVVGADVVKKYGGKVKLAKLEPGHSTSATIARMAKKSR
jgi:D-beta-D-heptose 7-phosphate kinase/D-beta-D-heptose 1-phosphate adenosyltransferase